MSEEKEEGWIHLDIPDTSTFTGTYNFTMSYQWKTKRIIKIIDWIIKQLYKVRNKVS